MHYSPRWISAALMTLMVLPSVLLTGCGPQPSDAGFQPERFLARGEPYHVTIHRDNWGVPHIFGKTDADTAFGFAYAQAEDDWKDIEAGIPVYRGTSGLYNGKEGATTDYLVQWLNIRPTINEKYATDLDQNTRNYLEAFADGLNYWAAQHPEQVNRSLFPITAQDLVAAYVFQHLLFYGFEGELKKLNARSNGAEQAVALGSVSFNGVPVGSNAFAVAPTNTPDGATRLLINSHQPLTGPVAWYEAHIRSEEGLDFMGGTFPGSPTMGLGFNRNIAWGVTVNKPDLVDIFRLTLNPEKSNQYRLDGNWVEFEKQTARIPVKLFPGLVWTFEREILRSKHGPVLKTDTGTYAIRYAGIDEIRQPQQWHRMNKANSLKQWRDAMSMQSFASFNFVFADKLGNISFVHNSLTPMRKPGPDWQGDLPGDDSSLIWQDYLPWEELPQITNPPSGYLHSANQSPFRVSAPGSNPDEKRYRIEQGFPTRMTNRAYRGLELFEQYSPISREDMHRIKYDNAYSTASRSYRYIASLFDKDFSREPDLQQAQKLLKQWNLHTDYENPAAALAVCVLSPEWSAEQNGVPAPPVKAELERCSRLLFEVFGRIDPPWEQVNRFIRGDFDEPIQGGPDVLRAVYGRGLEEDGHLTDVGGDGLFYFVEWDADGNLFVEGIHPFGSATQDTSSPHYADQSPLFVTETTKYPYYDPIDLMSHIERSYTPQNGIRSQAQVENSRHP